MTVQGPGKFPGNGGLGSLLLPVSPSHASVPLGLCLWTFLLSSFSHTAWTHICHIYLCVYFVMLLRTMSTLNASQKAFDTDLGSHKSLMGKVAWPNRCSGQKTSWPTLSRCSEYPCIKCVSLVPSQFLPSYLPYFRAWERGYFINSSKNPFPQESPLAFFCLAHCLDKEEFVCVTSHQALLNGSLGFGTRNLCLPSKWMPCWADCWHSAVPPVLRAGSCLKHKYMCICYWCERWCFYFCTNWHGEGNWFWVLSIIYGVTHI